MIENLDMIALSPFYVLAVAVTGKVVYDLFASADKQSLQEMISAFAQNLKKV